MDYTSVFWNHQFQPDSGLPPIPETDQDVTWVSQEDQNHYLPLVEQANHSAQTHSEATEIASLAEHTRQLQSKVLEVKERTEASVSELTQLVTKWSNDVDKLLVQMLKDIANLDRNYLKLMPWCLQVHEKVNECIAEKESGGKAA